ncbi:hypothetical protein [Fulvivirga ligni]|uniref:hypothetical protein n=1 Tax=Fulvivirga ligni TaxID=2904246 RepID=UPI001F20256E|nr:hypothetical protein [Fulvivirga ligni]UII19388.1 hypothetical protein LVD16_16220 [Fulvivirga ligni]
MHEIFKPSPIWFSVNGADTFPNFSSKIIPDFKLSESVPEAIRRRFLVIRKLLEFSYFEYEFIDIAMDRCYHTFELALHMKFNIEHPSKSGKKNFKPYLDWAVKEGFLAMNRDRKQAIAYLRNHGAHPKSDNLGGVINFKMIHVVGNQLVNELFEN